MRSLLLAVLLAGPAAAAQRPNFVLLTYEATRPEHLSAYGYERPTSPWLGTLAARGRLFRRAYAQAPWTVPSVAALLTSRYTELHHADLPDPELAASATTFLRLLGRSGYRTAGFLTGAPAQPRFGLARDLQELRRYRADDLLARQVDDAAAWAADGDARPFFLWIHAFHSHLPYECPAEARERFDPGYDGPAHGLPMEGGDPALRLRRMIAFIAAYNGEPAGAAPEALPPGATDLIARLQRSPRDLAHLTAHYDGCLRYMDDQAARLERALRARGLENGTVWIFSADHGEYLGKAAWTDRPRIAHPSGDLHDELLHVPLIVAGPGVSAGVDERPARLVDLAPTILTLAGAAPPPQMVGEDLGPRLAGRASGAERPVYSSDYDATRGRWSRAVLSEGWKLSSQAGGDWTLVDLEQDPAERTDRLAAQPRRFVRLGSDLLDELARGRPAGGR